jgi:hypothetical protein
MSLDASDKELYEQARKRVAAKKSYPWFIWPTFGWGIGLVFHFLGVWVFNRPGDWERREIEKEMDRLRKNP